MILMHSIFPTQQNIPLGTLLFYMRPFFSAQFRCPSIPFNQFLIVRICCFVCECECVCPLAMNFLLSYYCLVKQIWMQQPWMFNPFVIVVGGSNWALRRNRFYMLELFPFRDLWNVVEQVLSLLWCAKITLDFQCFVCSRCCCCLFFFAAFRFPMFALHPTIDDLHRVCVAE